MLPANPTFDTRPLIRVKTSDFPSFREMSSARSSLPQWIDSASVHLLLAAPFGQE